MVGERPRNPDVSDSFQNSVGMLVPGSGAVKMPNLMMREIMH